MPASASAAAHGSGARYTLSVASSLATQGLQSLATPYAS